MYLEATTARCLINMNPGGALDPDITDRQFEIIVKGFNHLIQLQNNFLYLADEVGLGKTYLALGIMALFRHFSEAPETHCNMVLVPKKNLQNKWHKDLHHFIRKNYLCCDGRVKSALNSPVGLCGEDRIHKKMGLFKAEVPSYQFFRNSSFSKALNLEHLVHDPDLQMDASNIFKENRQQFEGLVIQGIQLKDLFDRALNRYLLLWRETDPEIGWRKFSFIYAYLLNAALPKIDLLVVDEAHNFKGGYFESDTIRNNMVARYLGIRPQAGDGQQLDREIFQEFPELEELVRPLAKKVLFLSATPLDDDLDDMRRQLDCFLPQHNFPHVKKSEDPAAYHDYLKTVLMRGQLKIKVGGKSFSRNMYRIEHRNGNVKRNDSTPMTLSDSLDVLVMGVMQYQTLRHLKQKNNAQFELGMLAGFETFSSARSKNCQIYEESAHKDREAADEEIITNLVNSYQKTFNKPIPHAKQGCLVEELVERMWNGKKSLVFVRRIASTYELERKIGDSFAAKIHSHLEDILKGKRFESDALKRLYGKYNERNKLKEIAITLKCLAERLNHYDRKSTVFVPLNNKLNSREEFEAYLGTLLMEIFQSDDPSFGKFRQQTLDHIDLKKIKGDYRAEALNCLPKVMQNSEDNDQPQGEDELVEDTSTYFFTDFFRTDLQGKRFRDRMNNRSWFDLNIFLINQQKKLFCVDWQRLSISRLQEKNSEQTEQKRFKNGQQLIRNAIITRDMEETRETSSVVDTELERPTFLTELLLYECATDFQQWIDDNLKQGRNTTQADLKKLEILNGLLKGVFSHGQGVLPAYLAEAKAGGGESFSPTLRQLLTDHFVEVLVEVKTILVDFEMICSKNLAQNQHVGNFFVGLEPVVGISGQHKRNVSRTAARFRMPGWPYVLITTDILKEGEDLHLYCQDIYHYGVAWKASDMDQRNGRIDRIGSLSFRKIRARDKIEFDNQIHMFVPYLADTLEVNQISRVFHGMNRFVRTFNDFTQSEKTESTAETDVLVTDIPPQIVEPLEPIFDHDQFDCDVTGRQALCQQTARGLGVFDLQKLMESILNQLKQQRCWFLSGPFFDAERFQVDGELALPTNDGSKRRGPFSIHLINGELPGEYQVEMVSPVCQPVAIKRKKCFIEEKVNVPYSLTLIDGFYALSLIGSTSTKPVQIIDDLVSLVKTADNLEMEIMGNDTDVDVFNVELK